MVRFFALLGRVGIHFFEEIGRFSLFSSRILRSFADLSIYTPRISEQMVNIGNRSIPIVAVAAAFSGMVTAVQSAYQFVGYTPLYLIGSVVTESMVLEMGPVITALVLSGRVGAYIAAELGTMRVTEQLDALETLAVNPIAYLVIPRIIAGIVMLPVITVFANTVGILGGWIISITSINLSTYEFVKGAREFFIPWDLFYGLIKSAFFGAAITLIACYEGFHAQGGAQGVGRATTRTVVSSCITVLILDYVLAELLL